MFNYLREDCVIYKVGVHVETFQFLCLSVWSYVTLEQTASWNGSVISLKQVVMLVLSVDFNFQHQWKHTGLWIWSVIHGLFLALGHISYEHEHYLLALFHGQLESFPQTGIS